MKVKNRVRITVPLTSMAFLVSTALVVFCIFALNPSRLGPGGVTFWFLAFFVMVTSLVTLVFYFILHNKARYQQLKDACFYRSSRSGFIIGASLTVLLALSSLRSLSWRDFLLFIMAIVIIEVFFRTRRTTSV